MKHEFIILISTNLGVSVGQSVHGSSDKPLTETGRLDDIP